MKPRDFLALVRIPTVFSSMSNAYAGYFIGAAAMGEGHGAGFSPALLYGILAAALFIMAGMALNDVADKDVDARERPTRPIPAGKVTLPEAWGASLGMMAAGLALLWLANPRSAIVGAALALAIFAYNFLLKATWFGPAAMGLCRLLNLLAGISITWKAWPDFAHLPRPMAGALFSLWAYIALVTFLARDEVQGNSRRKARAFLIGFAAWMIAWSAAIWMWVRPDVPAALAWLMLALNLRVPLRDLAREPSPKHTGKMVGMLLRFVPLVDVLGMLANGVSLPIAIGGVLWLVPGYLVAKKFYST